MPWYTRDYREYKDLRIDNLGQNLDAMAETTNPPVKFALAILQNNDVVGHLPNGKIERYAKTLHFFLQAGARNVCIVVVTYVPSGNLSGKKGVVVLCNVYVFCDAHPFLERELTIMEV